MDTREPSQPQKRRWTWRQYSVSTLLMAVTIVCVFLALVVVPAERQRRAVAALRDLHVGVQYDFESQRRAPPGPQWLRPIVGVDYFAEVSDSPYRGYSARDVPRHATDEACVYLGMLTTLRTLHFSGTKVSDAGLAHLKGLTRLNELAVDNTVVTDAGLAHLAGLTSLEKLGVGRTQITDAGLAHLAGLTNLETLSLFSTQITDAGLAHLEGLTTLKELNLSDTRVTSDGCDKLRTALSNCRLRLF